MDEFGGGFFVVGGFFRAASGVHAARLKVAAVAARGNFAVFILSGHPHFQVVGFGGGESDIAGAQRHHAVGQFQVAQNGLGVGGHFLQCFGGFFGVGDLHQFNFFKLMLAQHSAGVLAVGPGFAAKARRVADKAQRQVGAGDGFVAHQIGHHHFGGGNQVELVALGEEEFVAEFGELSGAG